MPGVRANSVSSPPRPTPRPGWMRVPRWRTRMEPPLTSWPPKTFTPSRCAWESRPLREAAAPFLCAMSLLKVPGRSGLVGDWRRLGRRCNPGLRGRPLRAVASSDGRDLDQRVELAVAVADRVAAFVLVLEDDDLVALGVSQHLRSHRVRARLVADESPPVVGRDEDRREAHVVALVGEVLDLQHIPGLDPVLLSSGAYHCVHRSCLPDRPRRDRALEKTGTRHDTSRWRSGVQVQEDDAPALAAVAHLGEGLQQPLGHLLAGHLHEAELRDGVHLGARLVPGQGRPELPDQLLTVALEQHVDEVDDDDPADV